MVLIIQTTVHKHARTRHSYTLALGSAIIIETIAIREPNLSFNRSINRSAENDSSAECAASKLKSLATLRRHIDIRYFTFTVNIRFSIYSASRFIFICLTYDNWNQDRRAQYRDNEGEEAPK